MGKTKEKVLEAIVELADEVAKNPVGKKEDAIHFIFRQPGAVLAVGDAQSRRIEELARQWPWPPEILQHAAPGLLASVLRDAVVEAAIAEPAKRSDVAGALLAEKEKSLKAGIDDYVFLFEIDNLKLEGIPEARVGQCTFITLTTENMVRMKEDKRTAIVATGKWSGEDLEQVVKNGMYKWDEQVGKVFAQVGARGAFPYALEIASSRVMLALHFLKIVWNPTDDRHATLLSVAGFGQRRQRGIHFARRASKANFQTQILGDGPGLSYRIDAALTTWLRDFGLPAFNSIAESDAPGDLGRRLMAAVHLVGAAMNSTAFKDKADEQPKLLADDLKKPPNESGAAPLYWTRQERLLKLVMGGEALFNLHKDEPVGRSVKRRWVSIVEGSTSSLEPGFKADSKVTYVKDLFKEAYTLRSKVAHGQEAWIPRDVVYGVHYFLMVAIGGLLEAWALGIRSDAELERFIEARGLGFEPPDAVRHAQRAPTAEPA